MSSKVVVTGMGVFCSLGQNINSFWDNLLKMNSGISLLDISSKSNDINVAGKLNINQYKYLFQLKDFKRYDPFILYCLIAVKEALLDSGIIDSDDNILHKDCNISTILGSGLSGLTKVSDEIQNKKHFSPFFLFNLMSSSLSSIVASKYNLKGMSYSVTSACATSSHCILNGYYAIKNNISDIVVVGGSDMGTNSISMNYFNNIKALSKSNDPDKSSIPFDHNRSGFVLSDGAAVIILENEKHALKRGVYIYSELVGGASNNDAYHLTKPSYKGIYNCIKESLNTTKTNFYDIDYINAHATSTKLGDINESIVLYDLFPNMPFVNSTKSFTGHLLGASGAVESVVCIQSILNSTIHSNNIYDQDTNIRINCVPRHNINYDILYALNNSSGFGGHNVSLLFKRYI